MIRKVQTHFSVSQLDNHWACSSLLFKNMGPRLCEVVEVDYNYHDVHDPDVFFQMFDNLFNKEMPGGQPVTDLYGNPTDFFGQNIGSIAWRPFHYAFYIFYCANTQIETTGKFLESLGCTVQKSRAKKTGSRVALYVIESEKFLDHYENWLDRAESEGLQVFGKKRTDDQK